MEKYFSETGKKFYAGEKIDDFRPETHYMVGATPENIEIARDHSKLREELKFSAENEPVSPP